MIATLEKPRFRRPGIAPAWEEANWALTQARAPRIRSMREFAEQEVFIPDGPFKGRRFRVSRLPFTGLWLDAAGASAARTTAAVQVADTPTRLRFRFIATTGPSQSGKTLMATMIPLLYHLFEIGETVGFALPDMDMADDKWRKDILPVIEKTRFAELLPTNGEGSKGGKVKNMVIFRNGAALKFFSAGGGDKSRAHFTCRVLIVTEADAFGASGETSEEANKFEQLLARLRSFGDQAICYIECTVTVPTGLIWSTYKSGTASKIACPCPHCDSHVTPERSHLVGWQDAVNVLEARRLAHFVCPSCTTPLTEADRRQMNELAVLLHGDQAIDAATGAIVGEPPATETLGFRWSAFNNLLVTAGDLGVDEWNDARAQDEESAQRKQCQFVWCEPYTGDTEESLTLTANALMARLGPWTKGIVPADTFALTVGCDLGKRLGHYVVIAWTADGRGHVVDYGVFEIAADELGGERAILLALREWRDAIILPGYPMENSGSKWVPDQVWIDARYQGGEKGDEAVYAFVRESDRDRFRPIFGYGTGMFRAERYSKPAAVNKTITAIGEGYHFKYDRVARVTLVEIDADDWKAWFHARLSAPLADSAGKRLPGSLTLYKVPQPKEHTKIAKHWTAEKQVIEFIAGKGEVRRFERLSRNNHLLDACMIASSAGHFCGVRMVEVKDQGSGARRQEPEGEGRGLTLPDGRPFFVLER